MLFHMFISILPECILRSGKTGTVVDFPSGLLSHLTVTNMELERSQYLLLSGYLFEFPERIELQKPLMCFLGQRDGLDTFGEHSGDCC